MNQVAIMGKYFTTLDKAKRELFERARLKARFSIIQYQNGFLVIPSRQVESLKTGGYIKNG